MNTCAVVYENDDDFGDIDVKPLPTETCNPVSPSQMIDQNAVSHFRREQQAELLAVLDRYPECFGGCAGVDGCYGTFGAIGPSPGVGTPAEFGRNLSRLEMMWLLYIPTCGRRKDERVSTTAGCLSCPCRYSCALHMVSELCSA